MGWEPIKDRADFLGLTLFHKIHRQETRPLIHTCMPEFDTKNINLRSKGGYLQFPFKGVKFANSFFPYFTKRWNRIPLTARIKTTEDFKIYIKGKLKPKKYKFYSRGNKYKCSLLTRIRVGRSFLNEYSFTVGKSITTECACTYHRESPLHFITQCEIYNEARQKMLSEVEKFIPNISNISHKRQFDILVLGYERDNDELIKFNTKIMIATQNFIYQTKRFLH